MPRIFKKMPKIAKEDLISILKGEPTELVEQRRNLATCLEYFEMVQKEVSDIADASLAAGGDSETGVVGDGRGDDEVQAGLAMLAHKIDTLMQAFEKIVETYSKREAREGKV